MHLPTDRENDFLRNLTIGKHATQPGCTVVGMVDSNAARSIKVSNNITQSRAAVHTIHTSLPPIRSFQPDYTTLAIYFHLRTQPTSQKMYEPTPEQLSKDTCPHHNPTPTTTKHFLGIGIIRFVDRVPGFSLNSKQIQQMIDEEEKAMATIGIEHTMFELNPDDPNAIPQMKDKLQSRQWDGVIIGWGVRGTINLTGIFEVAVNLTVQEVRGVKLMFPTSPESLLESARRVFPELR